jgi:hypothetical protein
VGAPFEYFAVDHSSSSSTTADLMGGAVYIFYSRGVKQPKGAGHRVFLEPMVLRGRWPHSQFGAALTGLGNLDNDPKGYQGIFLMGQLDAIVYNSSRCELILMILVLN